MIEKVNPSHPDKIADRIAGAVVDLAYMKNKNPRIAVEVLIGHGKAHIIAESSVPLKTDDVIRAVWRIAGTCAVDFVRYEQDPALAENQCREPRCGDNGIFKGIPLTDEERRASWLARALYDEYGADGKYIIDGDKIVVCQSHATTNELREKISQKGKRITINPLGDWLGGLNVDTGATNRKLGSDMGHSVTGGGLHGKDLSKADVSVNIYAFL
ncbi:MAG: S-adenosylmethionine synthetase N-terminal domain-containing protein, partial [Ruminococcus flavefaciens]|nr:S-adenosylmethionine synthetase N-terminal domain-containing protein [Ruminococcus flavefaciens]